MKKLLEGVMADITPVNESSDELKKIKSSKNKSRLTESRRPPLRPEHVLASLEGSGGSYEESGWDYEMDGDYVVAISSRGDAWSSEDPASSIDMSTGWTDQDMNESAHSPDLSEMHAASRIVAKALGATAVRDAAQTMFKANPKVGAFSSAVFDTENLVSAALRKAVNSMGKTTVATPELRQAVVQQLHKTISGDPSKATRSNESRVDEKRAPKVRKNSEISGTTATKLAGGLTAYKFGAKDSWEIEDASGKVVGSVSSVRDFNVVKRVFGS